MAAIVSSGSSGMCPTGGKLLKRDFTSDGLLLYEAMIEMVAAGKHMLDLCTSGLIQMLADDYVFSKSKKVFNNKYS